GCRKTLLQVCHGGRKLFDLDQVTSTGIDYNGRRTLRGAPGIEDRDLVHAGDGAVRGAAFFAEVFAADIGHGVGFERNRGESALLRAVVHEPVFADVEVARAGAAAPLVGAALGDVVLKGVHAREAALLHGLHLVVDGALFGG